MLRLFLWKAEFMMHADIGNGAFLASGCLQILRIMLRCRLFRMLDFDNGGKCYVES